MRHLGCGARAAFRAPYLRTRALWKAVRSGEPQAMGRGARRGLRPAPAEGLTYQFERDAEPSSVADLAGDAAEDDAPEGESVGDLMAQLKSM